MDTISNILTQKKTAFGMVHLSALPGTPKHTLSVKSIIDQALKETKVYINAGIDGLIIENMHDVPYVNTTVGHEISSIMTLIAHEIKSLTNLPVGIQILAGANKQAVAVAHSASLDFIRAEGFVFGHIADEGYIDSCAAELLRYRKQIGADNVKIFTDIKKKHSSHAITSDIDILETAKAAEFFCSDGLIISGSSTGSAVNIQELEMLKGKVNAPIIIGSGIDYENITDYFHLADAFIVGSSFKKDNYWANAVDEIKVVEFMKKLRDLRS